MYCTCAKRCQSKYNTPNLRLLIATSQHTVSTVPFPSCLRSYLSLILYSIILRKNLHPWMYFSIAVLKLFNFSALFPSSCLHMDQFPVIKKPFPHWPVVSLTLYCEFRHHVEPQRCVSVWIFLLRHHWSSLWTTRLVH